MGCPGIGWLGWPPKRVGVEVVGAAALAGAGLIRMPLAPVLDDGVPPENVAADGEVAPPLAPKVPATESLSIGSTSMGFSRTTLYVPVKILFTSGVRTARLRTMRGVMARTISLRVEVPALLPNRRPRMGM